MSSFVIVEVFKVIFLEISYFKQLSDTKAMKFEHFLQKMHDFIKVALKRRSKLKLCIVMLCIKITLFNKSKMSIKR